MPESAVRGEEYIAVLSAHARKCASSAHFVLLFENPPFRIVNRETIAAIGAAPVLVRDKIGSTARTFFLSINSLAFGLHALRIAGSV